MFASVPACSVTAVCTANCSRVVVVILPVDSDVLVETGRQDGGSSLLLLKLVDENDDRIPGESAAEEGRGEVRGELQSSGELAIGGTRSARNGWVR